MKKKKKKSKLVITPEEEKSVGDYINHFHTQINVLSSFDVVKYLELFRKGWGLSGAEIISGTEKNDNEELGQTILDKVKTSKPGVGFDAAKEEYVDMKKAGIVDPTKVTRSAIQNAESVASMILTTESIMTEKKEKACNCGNNAPQMPDMGGMY